MKVETYGAAPATDMSGEYFTGEVWAERVIDAPDPARVRAIVVRFQPGAHTNWHTHPLGQTLYVLAGIGWVQSWGGPVREIKPGDVVWIEPGEKHWHGASAHHPMSHLAIHESLDGEHITWLDPVSDQQYHGEG